MKLPKGIDKHNVRVAVENIPEIDEEQFTSFEDLTLPQQKLVLAEVSRKNGDEMTSQEQSEIKSMLKLHEADILDENGKFVEGSRTGYVWPEDIELESDVKLKEVDIKNEVEKEIIKLKNEGYGPWTLEEEEELKTSLIGKMWGKFNMEENDLEIIVPKINEENAKQIGRYLERESEKIISIESPELKQIVDFWKSFFEIKIEDPKKTLESSRSVIEMHESVHQNTHFRFKEFYDKYFEFSNNESANYNSIIMISALRELQRYNEFKSIFYCLDSKNGIDKVLVQFSFYIRKILEILVTDESFENFIMEDIREYRQNRKQIEMFELQKFDNYDQVKSDFDNAKGENYHLSSLMMFLLGEFNFYEKYYLKDIDYKSLRMNLIQKLKNFQENPHRFFENISDYKNNKSKFILELDRKINETVAFVLQHFNKPIQLPDRF